jgi:hypothetical protein
MRFLKGGNPLNRKLLTIFLIAISSLVASPQTKAKNEKKTPEVVELNPNHPSKIGDGHVLPKQALSRSEYLSRMTEAVDILIGKEKKVQSLQTHVMAWLTVDSHNEESIKARHDLNSAYEQFMDAFSRFKDLFTVDQKWFQPRDSSLVDGPIEDAKSIIRKMRQIDSMEE